jgi:tRNA-splicing ligase RtcB
MSAPILTWLAAPLSREVAAALERLAASDDVQRIAVMPDVHLAEEVCIGTVVATTRLIYPAAVGGDIGCGVAALRFAGDAAERVPEPAVAAWILSRLYAEVPALQHAPSRAPAWPDALGATPLSDGHLERLKQREGRLELATLGRGNHFLELQRDDAGALWLMVHSGSRALGPAIRQRHLRDAPTSASGLGFLDADADAGQAYLHDLGWALDYAEASRRLMAERVAALLAERLGVSADWSSFVSCHHNHVRREIHDGVALWVHRKGAIPAAAGERGIIPGSMGTPSFHVEGRGHVPALASSSHGAGRAMSRSEARRTIGRRELLRQLAGVRFDVRRAEQLRDEAPLAYKDIRQVMRAQRGLTRIVRTLQPLLCYKGT